MNNEMRVNPMTRMNTLRDQMADMECKNCFPCLKNDECRNCPIKGRLEAKMAELRYLFWHAEYEEDQ